MFQTNKAPRPRRILESVYEIHMADRRPGPSLDEELSDNPRPFLSASSFRSDYRSPPRVCIDAGEPRAAARRRE